MGVPISLVLDCADPLRVGAFWRRALGYVEADPPDGYASWAEAAAADPADGIGYLITDPDDWFVVLQDPEGNEFCLV